MVTPFSALKPLNDLETSSTFTAYESCIAFLLGGHGAKPGFGELRHSGFALDIDSQDPLHDRSGQDVEEDRSDEGLQGEQWVHRPQTALPHLGRQVHDEQTDGSG